jgi:membrane protease YdiL (CAAX protease family)
MKQIVIPIIYAALLWFVLFSPWIFLQPATFWMLMSMAALSLTIWTVVVNKNFHRQFNFNWKDVAIGIISAVVLWSGFYLGDYFSSLLFDFAKPQVSAIYGLKGGENPIFIAILLLLVIGPAEEIFWRGFIQRKFGERYGDWTAWIVTTLIYTLVHIWSFNFMLIMAALVCGGFWGLLYKWNKNVLTLVISHALWDVAVFVLFPIG